MCHVKLKPQPPVLTWSTQEHCSVVCGLAPLLQEAPPCSPWRQTTWRLLSPVPPLAQEQGVQGEVSQRAGQGCSRHARVSLGRLLPPHLAPWPSSCSCSCSCSWPLVTQATVRCWTPGPQLCEQTATCHPVVTPSPRPAPPT